MRPWGASVLCQQRKLRLTIICSPELFSSKGHLSDQKRFLEHFPFFLTTEGCTGGQRFCCSCNMSLTIRIQTNPSELYTSILSLFHYFSLPSVNLDSGKACLTCMLACKQPGASKPPFLQARNSCNQVY